MFGLVWSVFYICFWSVYLFSWSGLVCILLLRIVHIWSGLVWSVYYTRFGLV